MVFLLWIVVVIGIPLVLGLRSRVASLERQSRLQEQELQSLTERIRRLRTDVDLKSPEKPAVAKPVATPPPVVVPPPPVVVERTPEPPPIVPAPSRVEGPVFETKSHTPPPSPPAPPP